MSWNSAVVNTNIFQATTFVPYKQLAVRLLVKVRLKDYEIDKFGRSGTQRKWKVQELEDVMICHVMSHDHVTSCHIISHYVTSHLPLVLLMFLGAATALE